MERKGSRFTGPRARAAEAAIFIAGLTAACQPQATEAPKPTVLPSESPVPTITVAPSESAAPSFETSPSPIATATPTEAPSAMPINSLIEGSHPKVTATEISTDLKASYQSNPAANTLYNFDYKAANDAWTICKNGVPKGYPGDPTTARFEVCEQLIVSMFQDYQALNDTNFYNVAKEVYSFTINALPTFKSQLDTDLKQTFK